MPSPRTRTTPAARTARHPDPDEPHPSPERPYGAWYPLVRLGHFLLMTLASCLIILLGLAGLGLLTYLIISLTR